MSIFSRFKRSPSSSSNIGNEQKPLLTHEKETKRHGWHPFAKLRHRIHNHKHLHTPAPVLWEPREKLPDSVVVEEGDYFGQKQRFITLRPNMTTEEIRGIQALVRKSWEERASSEEYKGRII